MGTILVIGDGMLIAEFIHTRTEWLSEGPVVGCCNSREQSEAPASTDMGCFLSLLDWRVYRSV